MRTPSLSLRPRGFTLVEIAVVLFIVAILIAMAAAITRGVTAGQKRSLTATRMAGVDAALVQFVAQQKRLPCPANGALASPVNTAGEEVCGNNQLNGVVPWKTLGLPEIETTDGWDRRLTYRVDPTLAAAGGMDMSWCDPAGTGAAVGVGQTCNNACVSTNLALCTTPNNFLLNKGLRVRNLGGTPLMNPGVTSPHTGAAYVVISHGESGGGGYLTIGGTLGASTTTDGTEEQSQNYASVAYVAATSYYVDDTLVESAGNGHFDDIVSRPSVSSVVSKAGLGPRAH